VEHGKNWELVAPSPLPAGEGLESPRALTIPEIHDMVAAWGAAARRADEAGFDVLEVHGAHGYLIHQFLSLSANHRTDRYGGSPTNRMRFAIEVVEEIRRHWPADKPLFFRVSAVDEDGGTIEATIALSRVLRELGVDVIDCSSGGMPRTGPRPATATPGYGYQVPYADQIRREAGIATMAVGLIIHADQAERILSEGRADLVALGREMIHNPNWTFDAADKLGMDRPYHSAPDAYGYWLEKRRHGGAELITEQLTRPSTWQSGIETASSVPT
jgi:2,4-dienoyl-CoA reductase-like NADH-dependent reductase (Old Yellow Enzyme family)